MCLETNVTQIFLKFNHDGLSSSFEIYYIINKTFAMSFIAGSKKNGTFVIAWV